MPETIHLESKRRHLLQQLASQGGSGVIVDLKPKDDCNIYLMGTEAYSQFSPQRDNKRPQTCVGGSKLPFRRSSTPVPGYQGSRVVGHIYGFNAKMEMFLNKNGQRRVSLPQTLQRKILLHSKAATYDNSTASPVSNFVHSSDLIGYANTDGGDNSNNSRQTSSSSSKSVTLERRGNHFSKHSPNNSIGSNSHRHRHKTIGNTTISHDRLSVSEPLPVVCTDDGVNSSVHILPFSIRQAGRGNSHQSTHQSSLSRVSSHKNSNSPTQQAHQQQTINPLSISGIKQDGVSRTEEQQEEDNSRLQPEQTPDKYITLTSKPPYGTNQSNGTTQTQPQQGVSSQSQSSYQLSTRRKQYGKQLSSGRASQNKPKSDEPKYADPIAGSPPSFQSRLAELASLEAETVRWERLRKLKKKPRDD